MFSHFKLSFKVKTLHNKSQAKKRSDHVQTWNLLDVDLEKTETHFFAAIQTDQRLCFFNYNLVCTPVDTMGENQPVLLQM